MSAVEGSDFPITRRTMERLDAWLMALASPLLPLKAVRVDLPHTSGYVWEFPEESERALLVGKAVRMISGIRAAFILAELGYISECGALLRMVSDFANEIIAVCEGYMRGAPTKEQQLFVQQYFKPLPKDPDEYEQEKERWVARDKLLKAHSRWATENSGDQDRVMKLLRYRAHMYDKYVHGAYITSTELYNPISWSFMLSGHESPAVRDEYKRGTASHLHEVITALVCMAESLNMPALREEISSGNFEL